MGMLITFSSSFYALKAQYLLYGTTISGGARGYGTIFSYNPFTGKDTVLYNFTGIYGDGENPDCDLLLAPDSSLYGLTSAGGTNFYGTIYNFNPKTNKEKVVHNFQYFEEPPTNFGGLTLGNKGIIYGTDYGNQGAIFSYNILTGNTKLFAANNDWSSPTFAMVEDTATGLFYGTTQKGGNAGDDGTIFRFDTVNNTISVMYKSDTLSGPFNMGSGLVKVSDSLLYGLSGGGGINLDNSGTIYKYNISTGVLTVVYRFTNESPYQDKLTLASNGLLYGMTLTGGTHNNGILFSFDPSSNTEATLVNFDSVNGRTPDGALTQDPDNGILYGMTRYGGSKDKGVLFSYNLTTSTFTKLLDFTGANGSVPGYKLTPSIAIQPPQCKGFTSYVTILSNPSCSNFYKGSATVSLSGGVAPYSYYWSNGKTTDMVSGLSSGIYDIMVYDSGDVCYAYSKVAITGPSPIRSAAITINKNISCYGGNNGIVTATPNGGESPFIFSWSNGATTSINSGLTAGNYSVTIMDSCGVTATASITLTQSASALTLSAFVTANDRCNGDTNGMALAIASGGTLPYSILWSINETTASIKHLASGNYSVMVTDSTGCTLTALVTITQPSVLTALVSVIRQSSCNLSNGSLTVTPGGGTLPYTYYWDRFKNTATITGLSAGTYTVDLQDVNKCFTNSSGTLLPYFPPVAPDICYVTVDTTSKNNVIVWQKSDIDTDAVDSVIIYREVVANVFTRVGEVSVHGHTEFTDQSSDPNNLSYFYTLGIITDSCGVGNTSANLNKTILLQSSIGIGNVINLSWNDYLGQTVNYYRILKDSLGNDNWEVLDSVPYGITSYTDHNPGKSYNIRYMINTEWNVNCIPSIARPPHDRRVMHYMLRTYDESYSNTSVINFTPSGPCNLNSGAIVYPNPVLYNLNVLFPNPVEGTLILSDMLGRVVNSEIMSGDNTTETIGTSSLGEGVYFLNIEACGQKLVKKVMKIKKHD